MGYNQKSDLSETIYIERESSKHLYTVLLYYMCRIFPIDNDKIVMWTFEGSGGYGCSPKYVAEEILKKNREGKTKKRIVWLLDDMSKEFPPEIEKVKNTPLEPGLSFVYSRCLGQQYQNVLWHKKEKKQCYIQTRHGTVCIKPIRNIQRESVSENGISCQRI